VSLVLPLTWLLVAPLLVASSAAAQPSSPARQRQDRRLALSALAEPPLPEVHVAAGNLTTLVFDAALEPDSLEVDRARFKLADLGEHSLTLEPASELGPGERLVVKVRFKDRALPEQAVLVLVSHPSEMDGKVEVERQTSTPEALRAALWQKQAELEQLKAQCAADGTPSPGTSEGRPASTAALPTGSAQASEEASGLRMDRVWRNRGQPNTVLRVRVRNLPDRRPWVLGHAKLTGPKGEPAPVLKVGMTPSEVLPEEVGEVLLETKTSFDTYRLELSDPSGQRHAVFTLHPQ
jgi:uncharacterized protein (TIGR02268 family)